MTDSGYILPEPSWVRIAEIAIALLEGGTSKGKESGREIVRDMGQKLADLREAQIEEAQKRYNRAGRPEVQFNAPLASKTPPILVAAGEEHDDSP